MGVLGKISKNIKNTLYAIPFGMKAGDELLATSNAGNEEGSAIHKQTVSDSVLQDILNGEVTQRVEELRYETFKAEEMANDYRYIGNGVAVKKKGDSKVKRKKFVQYNLDQEYGVYESLVMMENQDDRFKDDWKTRKTFKATYKNPYVKFRIENAASKVKVELNDNSYKTYFYFVDDKMNRSIRPLVNFLKKTMNDIESLKDNEVLLKTYKEKNEICTELETFSFTTMNATNDVPNGIDYNFSDMRFEGIKEDDGYVVLEYSWRKFDGNVLLSERFKSESAEKKFQNKEMREGYTPDLLSQVKKEVVPRQRSGKSIDAWMDKEFTEDKL